MTTSATSNVDKDELREVIAGVLDVGADEVGDETGFVDDLEVDSLMALEIVVVLEKKYGVRIAESQMSGIRCLDDAHAVLGTALAEGAL